MHLGKCLFNFMKFLQGVDSRAPGENIDPNFKCDGLNISLVFVGRQETMRATEYGYEPYLGYIRAAAVEGVKTFYVIARGKLNCYIADEVAWQAANEQIVKITDEYKDAVEYKGKQLDISCIRLENISRTYNPLAIFDQPCYIQ